MRTLKEFLMEKNVSKIFQPGVKVRRKNNITFSNGSKEVTVKCIDSKLRVWFKETGTYLDYTRVTIVEETK